MPKNIQTLNEFLKEAREELDKFEKFWMDNYKKNSYDFPLKMTSGDWWDQFQLFES